MRIPLIETRMNDKDRRILSHLMRIADILENDCPPSVIEWNRAIDREIAQRQLPTVRIRKPKRLPKHVKGIML